MDDFRAFQQSLNVYHNVHWMIEKKNPILKKKGENFKKRCNDHQLLTMIYVAL